MMFKRIHIYYIVSVLSGLLFFSCTENFKELNTDKSGITDGDMQIDFNDLRIPFDIIQQGIYFNYDFGKGKNWPYQIMQNLNADMFSGYMHDYKPHNGGTSNSDYNLQDGWNGTNWLYTYGYVLPNIKRSEDATYEKYPVLYAITKILKVQAMHRVTDIYGPIVYSSFGDEEGVYHPETQKEAYYAFFEDLDDAVRLLMENTDATTEHSIIKLFDILLDGEYVSWIKYANSLRMRLAIRIAMADPGKARTEFQEAFNNPYGFLSESNENVVVSTRNGYQNPLGAINRAWNEVQMNASMESILNGYEDPRRGCFFEPCAEDVILKDRNGKDSLVIELKGQYKGIRQGICFSHLLYASHSKIYVNPTTEPILMTAAEVWFLRAEAALRGWSGENAQMCYEEGIKTSFRQWGIAGNYDEYIYSEKTAADYIDVFDSANNIQARCKVTPRWIDLASSEEKLEKIITQKWLALFPEGCEAWSEQRRTGYPRLFPVRFNNNKDGAIDTEIMIRRLSFPADMSDTDAELYQSLQKILNAPDHAGTRLWWDTGMNF
ncbi:SusD/RagB family nutrient-binding outer membrane lipoprotein [Parabacteroides sp. PF5-9]|uniref:SusD/RagB family nutrient-binding outer membrane lipoprotein n=1 Tax=Parabacteroides sp. PF5-9 TaxID=1742404 RepID=UPI00247516B4|nr:SusD/RagB family nutrient-binding outer membrane lipoprotein [Parabacteroides sp. PF5-9]MDH6359277.1 hypothetical protein [Parabacteroides sp. PF5-9]